MQSDLEKGQTFIVPEVNILHETTETARVSAINSKLRSEMSLNELPSELFGRKNGGEVLFDSRVDNNGVNNSDADKYIFGAHQVGSG